VKETEVRVRARALLFLTYQEGVPTIKRDDAEHHFFTQNGEFQRMKRKFRHDFEEGYIQDVSAKVLVAKALEGQPLCSEVGAANFPHDSAHARVHTRSRGKSSREALSGTEHSPHPPAPLEQKVEESGGKEPGDRE